MFTLVSTITKVTGCGIAGIQTVSRIIFLMDGMLLRINQLGNAGMELICGLMNKRRLTGLQIIYIGTGKVFNTTQ